MIDGTVIQALDGHKKRSSLYNAIVNAPFKSQLLLPTTLGLGIIVLLLVDKNTNTLDRIALSNTELADGAVKMSAKPFDEIKIPLSYEDNYLVQVIKTNSFQQTEDWQHIFVPELTPQEARFNQTGAGIDCSIIYPLTPVGQQEPLGALIFSYYEPLSNIDSEHHAFMSEYSDLVANTLINS